jgi:hypothetical protein
MTPQDRAAADRLQELLVLPPSAGRDVCSGCSSWRDPAEPLCRNCQAVRVELRSACRIVIPISLYARPSAFRDIISRYKDRPDSMDHKMDVLPSDISQEHCAHQVRLVLNRFLIEIFPQLEACGLTWDYLTVVPSHWRVGTHPLVTILEAISVGKVWQPLFRNPGEILSHDRPNEEAFGISHPVEGKSLLLIDDVFTTGASIHSAAAALSAAGANVVAGIVIARRVRPRYNEYSQSVWARQTSKRFQWHIAAQEGLAIAQRMGKS